MESEQTFWLGIWKLVAIAFCVLVTNIAGCSIHGHQMLADAKDPMALSCAMGLGDGDPGVCTLVAQERNQ